MRKLITKGEIAELLEMSRSQVRFYEKKGLIKPQIDSNGYAMYDFHDLDKLELVKLLSELNTPIKEIKKIIDDEESYDYPNLLRKSHKTLEEEIKKLNEKKKIVEQRLKSFKEDQVSSFEIKYYEDRAIDLLIDDKIDTLKSVYDFLKINKLRYLDYENELYCLTTNNKERFGFFNQKAFEIETDVKTEVLKSGHYFSYTMTYSYDEPFNKYLDAFKEAAKKRMFILDEPLIFIDHFGRKFYYKDRGVGTFQVRIRP